MSPARELHMRLMNPPNAVHDDGIDLRRLKKEPAWVAPRVVSVTVPVTPGAIKDEISTLQGKLRKLRDRYDLLAGKWISIKAIQLAVAEHYGMSLMELCSQRRLKEIVRPRQVAIYLCRELTPLSLPQIAVQFGGRDHTTILSAIRRIAMLRKVDTELNAAIVQLTEIISNSNSPAPKADDLSPEFSA